MGWIWWVKRGKHGYMRRGFGLVSEKGRWRLGFVSERGKEGYVRCGLGLVSERTWRIIEDRPFLPFFCFKNLQSDWDRVLDDSVEAGYSARTARVTFIQSKRTENNQLSVIQAKKITHSLAFVRCQWFAEIGLLSLFISAFSRAGQGH